MIRIETLGRTRIFVQGRELTSLPNQPIRCGVLIYLAVERNVTRNRLVNIFWSDHDEKDARHALNQQVFELRKMLGEDCVRTQGNELQIDSTVQVDLNVFNEAIERGDLRVALEVYQGSFLQSGPTINSRPFEEWVDQRALKSRRAWVRASRKHVQELSAAGNIEKAIQLARHATELEPQEDELQHQLIELLANAGKRSEALAQYELYERALEGEELEPLDETKALVADMRTGNGREAKGSTLRAPPVARGDPHTLRPVTLTATTISVPDGGTLASEPTLESAPQRSPRSLRLASLLGVGVLTLGIIIAWSVWRNHRGEVTLDLRKVAVLYFSSDPDAQLATMADRFTEDLIADLNDVDNTALTTVTRDVVAQFKGNAVPPDTIASRLKARFLVSGSFNRLEDSIRVSIALVDGADGTQLDDASFTLPKSDVMSFQSTVKEAGLFLRNRLGMEIDRRESLASTRNDAARQSYIEARRLYDTVFNPNLDTGGEEAAMRDLMRADSMLALAEVLDRKWTAPSMLRAWVFAQQSIIDTQILQKSVGKTQRDYFDRAVAQADTTVRRWPKSAEAKELRGVMRFYLWRHLANVEGHDSAALRVDAEQDFREAVRDPGRVEAWYYLAAIAHQKGDFRNENNAALKAYRADAFARHAHATLNRLALSYLELHEDSLALAACNEGRRRYPHHASFQYCALSVLAWGDLVAPQVDTAWKLVREVQNWRLELHTRLARTLTLSGNTEQPLVRRVPLQRLERPAEQGPEAHRREGIGVFLIPEQQVHVFRIDLKLLVFSASFRGAVVYNDAGDVQVFLRSAVLTATDRRGIVAATFLE